MSESVRLNNLDVLKETEKAYQFRQNQRGGQYVEFWLPKGQITSPHKRYNSDRSRIVNMDLSIPEWLWAKLDGVQEQ